MQRGGSMGPYGRGATGGSRPGLGAGGTGRPGLGNSGAGATRPGLSSRGTGEAGIRPGTGESRPGLGARETGEQASQSGVRPGAEATRPGLGAGEVGRPRGTAVGRTDGTYHVSDNALYAQRNSVVAGSYSYTPFTPTMYAGYANAWQPTNTTASSLYINPGYGALASMLGMATQPAPYNYGGNVVAQSNAVYVNGDLAGTPQDYAAEASQIAASGDIEPAQNDQWQPIGVFAMVVDEQAQPNDFFQLAVNAQGTIRGNYFNESTNEATSLSGSVDLKTQRAAWTIGGDETPVYEVGIANLTGNEATMLVHTPDGSQRQFTLIRLPDPGQ